MDYDQVMQIIKKRRTTRGYTTNPIPYDYVDKVIEAACWAPTGANTQPFEFVVVKDRTAKREIRKIFQETTYSSKKKDGPSRIPPGNFLENAPVLIVVLGDPRFKEAYPKGEQRDEILHASLSAAVQNMHLAAVSLGLGGSVWTTVSPVAGFKIKDFLNIPQVFIIKTIMPLGHPKAAPLPPPRRAPVVHHESYDLSRFRSEEEIQSIITETALFKGKLSLKRKL
jgi:nitroreductase